MTFEEMVEGLRAGRELSIGPMRMMPLRLMAHDLIVHFLFSEPDLQLLSRHEQHDYMIQGVGRQTDTWTIFRAETRTNNEPTRHPTNRCLD